MNTPIRTRLTSDQKALVLELLSNTQVEGDFAANVIDKLVREFDDEGFKLVVTEPVLDHVVAESLRRETGARGLSSILARRLEHVAFDVFAEHPGGEVRLEMKAGDIEVRLG